MFRETFWNLLRAFFRRIVAVSGITFVVDGRGRKTAAVIALRKHQQPDFHDALLPKSQARDPRGNLVVTG